MVSAFMPDVVVEIAFNAGFTTPSSSRTWTDVSTYVELSDRINIAFGRQDERSTADANQLTLTLDNTDGRFTASRSASPYYPNVKIGRPIRVKVTPPGGSTVTRFVGFIDEWPVEWDGSDAYAKATITASSRMSRLGLTAKLRSMIENEVHAVVPHRYWTLGDPSGSTSAVESSGNLGASLTIAGVGTAVVFGNATGPGTDGLTAAEFATGQELEAQDLNVPEGAFAIHLTLSTVDTSATPLAIDDLSGAGGDAGVVIIGGQLGMGIDTSLGNVADGATHSILFAASTATGAVRGFFDGALVATTSTSGSGIRDYSLLNGIRAITVGDGLTGTVSHVAVVELAALTDADDLAVDIWDAVSGASEQTDERLIRVLGWAGVASTEVDAESGVETMTYQLTSGQSVVDALRDVESTEGGVLFDGTDGTVVFHNRSHRYLTTPAVTLDMESQHVGADYAPRLDRSTLVNDVTVSNPTTEESVRATDTASSDEYGIATASATSVADSHTALEEKAGWLLTSYAEPRIRVPSLTVDVLAHVGKTPSAEDLLGITVGDVIAVENAPTQSDTTSPSYFVEGYAETIGPESYFITFNLSPTYPMLDTFVLDSATRGLLDTSLLAY